MSCRHVRQWLQGSERALCFVTQQGQLFIKSTKFKPVNFTKWCNYLESTESRFEPGGDGAYTITEQRWRGWLHRVLRQNPVKTQSKPSLTTQDSSEIAESDNFFIREKFLE
jgi:hypothetical protein